MSTRGETPMAAARRGPFFRSATAAAIGLVVTIGLSGQGLGQAADPWIGMRVVVPSGDLKVGKQVVDRKGNFHVYRVMRTNGAWLWVEAPGISGWVKAADVVPFDLALDYFTNQIRSNPSSSWAYNCRGLIWNEKKENDIAIADYNEAIRLDPKYATAYINRGVTWGVKKEYDKALADFDEAIRLDPKDATAYNSRAWLWATCPDERFRDGKKAVVSATRACELSEWKEAHGLGTLAAACAESGDFDSAVKWQAKALELLPKDDPEHKGMQDRLALYKARKPYRQETPGP